MFDPLTEKKNVPFGATGRGRSCGCPIEPWLLCARQPVLTDDGVWVSYFIQSRFSILQYDCQRSRICHIAETTVLSLSSGDLGPTPSPVRLEIRSDLHGMGPPHISSNRPVKGVFQVPPVERLDIEPMGGGEGRRGHRRCS